MKEIIFSQEFRLKNQGFLKELPNRTLRTEVTVLFNTALRKYAFSTVSFEKLVFRFKTLKYVFSYYAILLCKFIMQFCSNFILKHTFYKYQAFYKNSIVPKLTFRKVLSFFKKIIKKSVEQSKNKKTLSQNKSATKAD